MATKAKTRGPSLEAMQIAHELAARGARTSIIEALAGVTQGLARQVIRDVTSRDPRSGLLPISAATMVSSRRRHAEASIAGAIYQMFRDPSAAGVKATDIIKSYDTYLLLFGQREGNRRTSKSLTLTEFYIIARDLCIGSAEIKRCNRCNQRWLYCPEATNYIECPHCHVNEQTCPSCGQAKTPRARLCHECRDSADGAWESEAGITSPGLGRMYATS